MTLEQAKEIVGKMVLWIMNAKGVDTPETPKPITEDLKTLIKANEMVDKDNKRQLKSDGKKTICMTLDDRAIAALYVAANFQGTSASDIDVLALHKNNIVICLNKNELKD